MKKIFINCIICFTVCCLMSSCSALKLKDFDLEQVKEDFIFQTIEFASFYADVDENTPKNSDGTNIADIWFLKGKATVVCKDISTKFKIKYDDCDFAKKILALEIKEFSSKDFFDVEISFSENDIYLVYSESQYAENTTTAELPEKITEIKNKYEKDFVEKLRKDESMEDVFAMQFAEFIKNHSDWQNIKINWKKKIKIEKENEEEPIIFDIDPNILTNEEVKIEPFNVNNNVFPNLRGVIKETPEKINSVDNKE